MCEVMNSHHHANFDEIIGFLIIDEFKKYYGDERGIVFKPKGPTKELLMK